MCFVNHGAAWVRHTIQGVITDPDALRILCCGDSNTYGTCVGESNADGTPTKDPGLRSPECESPMDRPSTVARGRQCARTCVSFSGSRTFFPQRTDRACSVCGCNRHCTGGRGS